MLKYHKHIDYFRIYVNVQIVIMERACSIAVLLCTTFVCIAKSRTFNEYIGMSPEHRMQQIDYPRLVRRPPMERKELVRLLIDPEEPDMIWPPIDRPRRPPTDSSTTRSTINQQPPVSLEHPLDLAFIMDTTGSMSSYI